MVEVELEVFPGPIRTCCDGASDMSHRLNADVCDGASDKSRRPNADVCDGASDFGEFSELLQLILSLPIALFPHLHLF